MSGPHDAPEASTRQAPPRAVGPLTETGSAPPAAATPPGTADLDSCPTRPRIGLGQYVLLEEIGSGGMGVVYKARHVNLDRVVALKTLRRDRPAEAEQARRFEREMRAAARLDHPHVVRIFEVGAQGDLPFYTMPYLGGGTLAERRPQLLGRPREVAALIEKIAGAVHYAHEQGVLHRDLKPSNVLLDDRGEPCVVDFGLAKVLDDVEMTRSNAVLGTPAYMAPEQAAGDPRKIGPPTDVWALGVILYELLVGRRPFLADSGEEMRHKIQTEPPPDPLSLCPELPPGLAPILRRCLEKEPGRRYASAAELAEDLRRYLAGRPPRAARRSRRATVGVLVGAAVLAAAAIVGGFWRRHATPTEPTPDPSMNRVLIGGDVWPEEPRWLAGADKVAAAGGQPGGPFVIEGSGAVLLELQPQAPWEHYRLEARLRHDASTEGEAGIFFGYGRYQSVQGTYHSFWKVGFAETGNKKGQCGMSVWDVGDATGKTNGLPVPGPAGTGQFKPDSNNPRWHDVAVEVGPLGATAYFDGRVISVPDLEILRERSSRVFRFIRDVKAVYDPLGPLGVYVKGSKASFEKVSITRRP